MKPNQQLSLDEAMIHKPNQQLSLDEAKSTTLIRWSNDS